MKYVYVNDKIALFIGENVNLKFLDYIQNYDYRTESGGIIVGILNPAEKQIIVTDVTEPYESDKRSTFSFKRSECDHQEAMDVLWEESGYTKTYLGEWHTHNQKVPYPSYIDKINWIRISKRKRNSQLAIFIIIGTKEIGVWTVKKGKVYQLIKSI